MKNIGLHLYLIAVCALVSWAIAFCVAGSFDLTSKIISSSRNGLVEINQYHWLALTVAGTIASYASGLIVYKFHKEKNKFEEKYQNR